VKATLEARLKKLESAHVPFDGDDGRLRTWEEAAPQIAAWEAALPRASARAWERLVRHKDRCGFKDTAGFLRSLDEKQLKLLESFLAGIAGEEGKDG
jgi:hypothetical protein